MILPTDLFNIESKSKQTQTIFKSKIKAFQGLFKQASPLIEKIDFDEFNFCPKP